MLHQKRLERVGWDFQSARTGLQAEFKQKLNEQKLTELRRAMVVNPSGSSAAISLWGLTLGDGADFVIVFAS